MLQKLTPMMKQYMKIKSNHKDCLLLYRMGDFYELFFEDAEIAAQLMNIVLTHRGVYNEKKIPMCGIPYHSFDSYIAKLLHNGHKIAVCEQMETPQEAKKRGYNAVVKREVVRIITPSTITDDNLINNDSNLLLAITGNKNNIAISWCDILTGTIASSLINKESLESEIMRLTPKEIIINSNLMSQTEINNALNDYENVITTIPSSSFNYKRSKQIINDFYQIPELDANMNFDNEEVIILGVIIEYIANTQKNSKPFLKKPFSSKPNYFMYIDQSTRKNLELSIGNNNDKTHTIFHSINNTKTAGGYRLLSYYLSNPLLDINIINNRQESIEYFINNYDLCKNISNIIYNFPDAERSLSRINLKRCNLKDINIIKYSIKTSLLLAKQINKMKLPIILHDCYNQIEIPDTVYNAINENIKHDAVNDSNDFILHGSNPEIDTLKQNLQQYEAQINDLQSQYQKDTNINTLKINHNSSSGYFIEVSRNQSSNIKSEKFIQQQTMKNNVRYKTNDLYEIEANINITNERINNLEQEIYNNIIQLIIDHSYIIMTNINVISQIDLFTSLADLSIKRGYVRPIVNESNNFIIEAGKHCVLEQKLGEQTFIDNDCYMNNDHLIHLITGPNMAGKSTFLRQNAILIILAQAGFFIPAKKAEIGIVDKLFSRIGASDNIAEGKSTFMVEMIETSIILHNITNKSFVIMDEVGRGTATYDGIAIAQAILEYIQKINTRTLFSTHYHELTSLDKRFTNIKNYFIEVQEWQNEIIFMYKVKAGKNLKSYGINVAKLAHIPQEVIKNAEKILKNINSKKQDKTAKNKLNENNINEFLKDIDIDNLSPMEALRILYKIKNNQI